MAVHQLFGATVGQPANLPAPVLSDDCLAGGLPRDFLAGALDRMSATLRWREDLDRSVALALGHLLAAATERVYGRVLPPDAFVRLADELLLGVAPTPADLRQLEAEYQALPPAEAGAFVVDFVGGYVRGLLAAPCDHAQEATK